MEKFIVTCCSTVDLPLEYMQQRNIPFECFHCNMDGKDIPDDLGQSITPAEFYKRIADGAQPTTSQVSIANYMAFWEPFIKEGKPVLHITLSSGLSGSYNSACLAKEELLEKYPDAQLEVVDSLGASSGSGLLVAELADMRDAGKTLQEATEFALANRLRVHHWFFSTDLTSFFRGGRISRASCVFGTMLNICPLMNMDPPGHLIPRSKCRGKKKAMQEQVARMVQFADNGAEYDGKCFISHSACEEDAKAVAALVEENFPKLKGKVMLCNIGTVIGAHTGPGTVALFFMGAERVD